MLGSKEIFSISDIAILTGIPVKTVRRAIIAGELVALRFNKRVIMVRRFDLEQWLDRCTAAARVRIVRGPKKALPGESSRAGDKSA